MISDGLHGTDEVPVRCQNIASSPDAKNFAHELFGMIRG